MATASPALTDTPGRMRKTQARSTVRRNAIAETAWRLISERGFDATSVNTIIAELGISKGSFYHHFESKAAVIDAVVEMLTTEVRERVAADNATGTALERLVAFIRSGWEWHEEHVAVSAQIILVMLRPENLQMLARISATEQRVFRPLLEDIVAQGRREKVFDVPAAAVASDLLMPTIYDATIRITRQLVAGNMGIRELLDQLRFLQLAVERMLGAPAGSLAGALPTTKASRKTLQRFIDGLIVQASPSSSPPGDAK